MKIIKKNIEKDQISFLVSIEKKEWDKMQEKAFKKIAKNLKISGGFRPGTPAHLDKAKSMINKKEILDRALTDELTNINKFLISQKEFLEIENDILNESPNLSVDKLEEELLLNFKYKKIPEVKLGDYKKISIKVSNKVSEEEINKEIDRYIFNNSELVPKSNGKIEKNDFVIFDFEGYIDNKKMKNGSSKNFELEIGSNQFIPGFEDQMIGLKIGEEKKINLKFPNDYHEKSIANKDAIFEIKINDIKEKKLPKINDQFVKSLNIENIDNINDFKEFIKNDLENKKIKKNKEEIKAKLFSEIEKITELSHADNFSIDNEAKFLEDEYKKSFSNSGIDFDMFLKITNQNKEKFYKNIKDQAYKNVKIKYAIIEISEKEKIDITDKELELYLLDISKHEKIDLLELKEKIGDNIELIKEKLIFNKTIDFLLKNSIVEDK